MKIIKPLLYIFCLFICATTFALASPAMKYYPHWKNASCEQLESLTKIDQFIEQNKNKNYVAIFDWDGTLYSEQMPFKRSDGHTVHAGICSLWHNWAATHISKRGFGYIAPMLQVNDQTASKSIFTYDDVVEGRTDVGSVTYLSYTLFGIFDAGMTPKQLMKGYDYLLNDYRVEDYAFLPMLDLFQHMIDAKFDVWIVSGSNPYSLRTLLKRIEHTLKYTEEKPYKFNLDHIVGNKLKLLKNGTFSIVYDDVYVKNPTHKLYVVGDEGKWIAMKYYILPKTKQPILFYAGNSGGDYWGIEGMIHQPNAMVVAVNPKGSLLKLIEKYPQKIVTVRQKSKLGDD